MMEIRINTDDPDETPSIVSTDDNADADALLQAHGWDPNTTDYTVQS